MKKILFTLLLLFISIKTVNANTTFKISGTTLNTTNYASISSGWKVFDWSDDNVYSASTFPYYFAITICTDAAPIVSYVNNIQNGFGIVTLTQVHVYNTNASCMFPDSTYTGAHLVYIIGEQVPTIGSSTNNWLIDSGLTFYNNATASYSLISVQYSKEYISYNAETNTIISQNSTIINQNDTIINGQNNINNSVNNVDNTLKDSSVTDPTSDISNFNTFLANNSTITNLITLPITLFQKVLTSLNGTCSSYDLGEFKGTHIILPCINISNYIGSTLFNVIDVLISGIFVYSISKKFVKVFEHMSSMKDGDIIND